uniref:ATP synthase F0 subunit 8 n=1 Tax=Elateroidea sp. 10 KM-2017 TaxID=2219424 RepID=A0A346RGZ5_9COLE|nr:ATP synthase F0 subunit 8 [Elateroidea sp. 10 KM-2017]
MYQMSPLNWLTLFLYFTVIYMMINSINYSSFKYKHSLTIKPLNKINFNWKW